jgi:predicted amidohydrolase
LPRQACSDAGITAVVGLCKKRAGTTGTMFNTQLFIGPDGQLLGKHRKLMRLCVGRPPRDRAAQGGDGFCGPLQPADVFEFRVRTEGLPPD